MSRQPYKYHVFVGELSGVTARYFFDNLGDAWDSYWFQRNNLSVVEIAVFSARLGHLNRILHWRGT